MSLMLRPAARADLDAVVRIYVEWDLAMRGQVESDAGDILRDWDAPGFDLGERARVLVGGDGEVAGYAVASLNGDADSVTRPGAGGDDLLLGWLESLGEPLRHFLHTDDTGGGERMRRRGWVADRTYWRMRVELDEPTAEPRWPNGVTVTGFDVDRHAREVHELIQDSFADVGDGHRREDFGTWEAAALRPDRFDADLCRVVVDDGRIVAAVLAHPAGDIGFVPQLAVAEAARGRGLGLALLHEGFRRCAARGLAAVELAVDSANATGATRLYERAGMHVIGSYTRWAWTPPPGDGQGDGGRRPADR